MTTLTPASTVTVTSNIARAIDLSASTTAVAINNTGTITGDVLLNTTGDGTAFSIGGGTATGSTPFQQGEAAAAATATGHANTPDLGRGVGHGRDPVRLGHLDVLRQRLSSFTGQLTTLSGTLEVNVVAARCARSGQHTTTLVADNFTINGGSLTLSTSEALREQGTATVVAKTSATLASGTALGVQIGSFVPQGTDAYQLIAAPIGALNIAPASISRPTRRTPSSTTCRSSSTRRRVRWRKSRPVRTTKLVLNLYAQGADGTNSASA